MHPLLRATLDTSTKVSHFAETTIPVAFKEYSYEGPEQWKHIAKKDLAKRFDKEGEPLWRVSLLKGEIDGQILVTFHHAIADGVCAAQMMNHLYQAFAALLRNEPLSRVKYNTPIPDLASLYPLSPQKPPQESPIPTRTDKNYHTTFVKTMIDGPTTTSILKWTKEQGIKMHATLFAALLQAVRRVINPDFENFTALTVVNYRSFFNPPLSKEVLALLRTGISDTFCVQKDEDFASLAKSIHQSVHSQLASGEPSLNLKVLEDRLSRDPTPQELWQRAKFPANAVVVTNLGSVDFSGNYDPNLSLTELFFVANVEAFIEETSNVILGTLTFDGKISLALWFLKELVEESTGEAILLEMNTILANLAHSQPALV